MYRNAISNLDGDVIYNSNKHLPSLSMWHTRPAGTLTGYTVACCGSSNASIHENFCYISI